MEIDDDLGTGLTKRQFVKKAAYVVPAVLTLAAAPSFAAACSNGRKTKKHGYAKEAEELRKSKPDH
jgi:hypothetical protein